MRITLVVAFVILLIIPDILASDSQSDSDDDDTKIINVDPKAIMQSMTALDMTGRVNRYFALLAALAAPERNMVCSPLSALLPIGKLALGAQGKARKQLYGAVGDIKDKHEHKRTFDRILYRLRHLPGVTLDVASRLYVSSDAKIKPDFSRDAKKIFHSSCEKVDFSSPYKAAESINSWVAKQTNGMIPDIISPVDISQATSLIVVNAIYFNGKWKYPFREIKTGTFHTPREPRKVPMMHQQEVLNYYTSPVLNAQIIELPYLNEHTTFVIVLPHKKYGLTSILNQLVVVPNLLSSEIGKMRKTDVDLRMPKFKVQTHLDLKVLLQKIGVRALFTSTSALPDIIYGSLIVTKMIQKAVIEVTEFGTEAAAATAINIEPISMKKRKRVNVDHPFLFMVKVKRQQLFMGILNSP